jgi:hypothetical protein
MASLGLGGSISQTSTALTAASVGSRGSAPRRGWRSLAAAKRTASWTGRPTAPGRQGEGEPAGFRLAGKGGEQTPAVADGAVVSGAHQDVGSLVRQPREELVDIGLAIGNHGDERRAIEPRTRPGDGGEPAMALLALDRLVLIVVPLRRAAPPDRRPGKPQHRAVDRIDRQSGMDEQADVAAVADPPEPALAPRLGLIVDLRRILDQRDMPARRRFGRPRRRRRQDLFHGHPRIMEKPPEADRFRTSVGKPAQRRRATQPHALQHLPPLFSRRLSPKYPSSQTAFIAIAELPRTEDDQQGITHDSWPARKFDTRC